MKTPYRVLRSHRPENERFRLAIVRLRGAMKWTQLDLALKLGISKRTLSHWENGYWLPPLKQRLQIIVTLRNADPDYVLELAHSLGVSTDDGAEALLQPIRDAVARLDDEDAGVVAPPSRVPPSPEALRAAVDAVVREQADTLSVAANDLRQAIGLTLTAALAQGATLEEVLPAVSVKPRPKAGPSTA